MVKLNKLRLVDIVIFSTCILLHFINHLYRHYIDVPVLSYLLKCYFNDFLGGMAFLAYTNLVLSFYKDHPIRIKSYFHVILIACLCSFFWEWLMPLFKPSTADWWDCVAYTLGATCYWIFDKYIFNQYYIKYSNFS